MTVTLQVIDGPGLGRKIFLQPGERVTVGRTSEADYSFSDNPEMSSLHFAIICEWPECYVHDLHSSNGTLLNGEPVTHAELKHGDEVKAGQDQFRISLDGSAASADTSVHDEAPRDSDESSAIGSDTMVVGAMAGLSVDVAVRDETRGFLSTTAGEICGDIKGLGDAARDVLTPDLSPQGYLAVLEEKELFIDAIRFLAHALVRRDAVAWAADCVESAGGGNLPELDSRVLEITRAWVDAPNEENRRAAMAAAETLDKKIPARWAAVGAFYSEGSMARPQYPPLAAPRHATSRAVAGSVMLAAVQKEPEKAQEKQRGFVKLGIKRGTVAIV